MKKIEFPNCQECDIEHGFFCGLSTDDKGELSHNKGHSLFKKGQHVFYEGNHAIGVYCLYKGKVKLTKIGKEGKEHIIRFSKPGDIIGYRSLLNDEPYQATATALEDTYVCVILKSKFLEMVDKNRIFSKKIISLLGDDLKSAEENIVGLTQKSVKERIAEALILLINTYGYKEDGVTINVGLSRLELANLAGTTPETTIRTLASMVKENYIVLHKKEIRVPCFKKLMSGTNLFD